VSNLSTPTTLTTMQLMGTFLGAYQQWNKSALQTWINIGVYSGKPTKQDYSLFDSYSQTLIYSQSLQGRLVGNNEVLCL
jgi:hypothetical protein